MHFRSSYVRNAVGVMKYDLPNIHPGEVLREEFLIPLGLTAYRLSKDIGVPQTRISEILAEKRSISADTARRLGRYFGTSAQFWLGLQNAYDLEEEDRRGVSLDDIPRCPALKADPALVE